MVDWVYVEFSDPVFYKIFSFREDLQCFIDSREKKFKWTYFPEFYENEKQLSLFDY